MEDKKLVDMICLGDEEALIELNNVYGRMMYCVSLSVTGHHEDAEECCNETLYIMWKNIPRVRPQYLKGYIKTVVYRVSMNKRDYNTAQKRSEFNNTFLNEDGVWCGHEELYIERIATINAINNFIDMLSEEKYRVFVARYRWGFLVKDIAKKEKISVSKVKMMLLRMKHELKKYLKEENIFL